MLFNTVPFAALAWFPHQLLHFGTIQINCHSKLIINSRLPKSKLMVLNNLDILDVITCVILGAACGYMRLDFKHLKNLFSGSEWVDMLTKVFSLFLWRSVMLELFRIFTQHLVHAGMELNFVVCLFSSCQGTWFVCGFLCLSVLLFVYRLF